VATPEQVSVWVGLDVGKEAHFADVLDSDGERLFSRPVGNDQGDIEARACQIAARVPCPLGPKITAGNVVIR
jgi:hypothetical protein